MTTLPPIAGFLLLLGLGFFFGLAFEEFHAQGGQARPGGVRSFPLLALAGALLYRLDTERLLPLSVGLLVLGLWLTCYYWRHVAETDPEGRPNVGLMVPICNVLAYLLGPIALAEPPWMAIGVTVVAVLLLTAREKLHRFARGLAVDEIVTAGKFLILTGLVLPFLPNEPVTHLTEITPHQVWLAVLAVATVSYASYLLQRYVAPPGTAGGPGPGMPPYSDPLAIVPKQRHPFGAVVLIVIGLMLLLHTLGIFEDEWIGRAWPIILIGIGAWLLYRRTREIPRGGAR